LVLLSSGGETTGGGRYFLKVENPAERDAPALPH